MAKSITASVVVQFTTSDSDGVLVVEVDDREAALGGLNGGRTNFSPGDTVHLLAFKGQNVNILHRESNVGALYPIPGQVTVTKTEYITFAGETEANLRYPVSGNISYEWLGRNLGAISLVGDNTLRVPDPPVGEYAVGVAKITYSTVGQVYRLTHSPLPYNEYPIVAFFVAEAL